MKASIKNDHSSNFTWYHNTLTAVLDYIWILQHLLQYLIYKKHSSSSLYKSDHKIMTLVLDSTRLLKQPSIAYNRSHDIKRKVYLYKEMTENAWSKFSTLLDG